MPFLSVNANLAQIHNNFVQPPGNPNPDIGLYTKIDISNPRDHTELLSMPNFRVFFSEKSIWNSSFFVA